MTAVLEPLEFTAEVNRYKSQQEILDEQIVEHSSHSFSFSLPSFQLRSPGERTMYSDARDNGRNVNNCYDGPRDATIRFGSILTQPPFNITFLGTQR